jgi:ABC-2 type transport system ATP-binding protein
MDLRSDKVIEVSNLFKAYGNVTAVNHISFELGQGEVFGMLGPNGAGKTTTVEIIKDCAVLTAVQ